MVYHCCICGTEYTTESAAVKCVNRCGRKMHESGIFQTKPSKYSGETTEVSYDFNIDDNKLESECYTMMDKLQRRLSRGVFNSFISQLNQWNSLTNEQKRQLHDMISIYIKD